MMNLVWLNTYCELVKQRHFTKTAEALHMTQSGVSQHIKKLEGTLNNELLIREGKSFTLTEAGKQLFEEATELLDRFDNLQQKVSHDPADEGVIRMMSPGSVGTYLYPRLLEQQKRFPKLLVDCRFAPNDDVEQALVDDRIDIGLVTSPPESESISSSSIAEEELLLVTPSRLKVPSWDNLQRLGFINHPDGEHHARQLLAANFPEFEHPEGLSQSGFINQISLILEPVSMGMGFTVLPQHAVKAFNRQNLINSYPLDNPVSETLYLCQRRGRVLPQRIINIISFIKEQLR